MRSGLGRVAAAALRGALWLVPGARREWVAAVWAETPEVSPGWRRLAWRAGGVRLIAREVLRRRLIGNTVLLAVAAAGIGWGAWRDSPANYPTSVYRVDVITVVGLLAGLPLLARLFFGPALDCRAARFLRLGTYAGILTLVPAKGVVEQVLDVPPRGGVELRLYRLIGGPGPGDQWGSEIVFLVVVAIYLAVVLWVTSRRSRVAPATLAIGTVGGIALSLLMYTVAPLGLSNAATDPWLPGSDVDPLVVLAWILLLVGPVAAAAVADRRYAASSSSPPSPGARARQIVSAGVLANLVGALLISVAATGTTALMAKSAWLRHWLYHGRHQFYGVGDLRLLLRADPAAITYSHQITAAVDAPAFLFIGVPFVLVALVMTGFIGVLVWYSPAPDHGDPHQGRGGPHGDEPPWLPPDDAPLDDQADGDIRSPVSVLPLLA
jgi:hypothetical protein